jgi:hypothetical protein
VADEWGAHLLAGWDTAWSRRSVVGSELQVSLCAEHGETLASVGFTVQRVRHIWARSVCRRRHRVGRNEEGIVGWTRRPLPPVGIAHRYEFGVAEFFGPW